jgi:ComF family protein
LSDLNCHDEDKRWFLCLSNPLESDPCPGLALYMPFSYSGIVERAMPKIKFGRNIELARFFGCVLGSFAACENISADLVMPIPLSEKRMSERGFNQAGEIALPVAKLNGIPFAEDCLARIRNTGRQSDIRDTGIRQANVSNAFAVSKQWDVSGLKVIVVDDVATTGATLHEAAAALYKAGARKVLCAAFAGNRQVKNAEPF